MVGYMHHYGKKIRNDNRFTKSHIEPEFCNFKQNPHVIKWYLLEGNPWQVGIVHLAIARCSCILQNFAKLASNMLQTLKK